MQNQNFTCFNLAAIQEWGLVRLLVETGRVTRDEIDNTDLLGLVARTSKFAIRPLSKPQTTFY
jgi:hypothetical protein